MGSKKVWKEAVLVAAKQIFWLFST